MIDRAEIKERAKSQIRGNIGILFICSLVIGLIISAGSLLLGAGLFIAPSLGISTVMIYLALAQGARPQVGDVFKGLGMFGKALWLSIITGFFVSLWSMLFVIPGIIKSYAYSLAPYIIAENPDMAAGEALNESKRITNGHKADLFMLQLSFIGWLLLAPLTLGLLFIWLIPYMEAAHANFYNAIKANSQGTGYPAQQYQYQPGNYPPAAPSAAPAMPPPAVPAAPFPATINIPPTMPIQQPAAPTTSSSLVCTKGHYAGAAFPINSYLFFGRDPKQCQLIFPNEAKGISSLHCEVRQQNGSVTLTDKGSTYGTFVIGRKLSQNESVTLNPGDSFYLADGANEFKLL